MIEVELFSVMSVQQANHWAIVLKEKAGRHYLPIWTGSLETRPILLWMGGIRFQRPMHHDLLSTAVERLGLQQLGLRCVAWRRESSWPELY